MLFTAREVWAYSSSKLKEKWYEQEKLTGNLALSNPAQLAKLLIISKTVGVRMYVSSMSEMHPLSEQSVSFCSYNCSVRTEGSINQEVTTTGSEPMAC